MRETGRYISFEENGAVRTARRRQQESCGELYRELTGEGKRFCALAGLLEELVVLAAFGIRITTSPVPVLAFLWVLFAILTAAALIGADWLMDRAVSLRAVLGSRRAFVGSIGAAPVCGEHASTASVCASAVGSVTDRKEERQAA